MKKTVQMMAMACALPLVITACGKNASTSNPVENAQQAAQDADLQGKIFRGNCNMQVVDSIVSGIATGGAAAIKGAREQYQFVGANVTHATVLFNNADCSGDVSMTYREYGSFKIDNDKKSQDGGKNIDIDYNKVTVEMGNDTGVKIAKDMKLCGRNDWTADKKEVDVTSNSSQVTCYRQKLPLHISNIYLVDGKDLFFGAKGAVNTNGGRPSALDRKVKFSAE